MVTRHFKDNKYLVYLLVKEQCPKISDMLFSAPDSVKLETLVKTVEQYFELRSKSGILKDKSESQIKTLIIEYLNKNCNLQKIGEAIIWDIGAYLVLTPKNNYRAADAFNNIRTYPWVRMVTVDLENHVLNFEEPPK